MKFIACDTIVGYPRIVRDNLKRSASDLLVEMDKLGVLSAVVRHELALWAGPVAGNKKLFEDIQQNKRLLPAWFVTPDGHEPDFNSASTIDEIISGGMKICWFNPKTEIFSIQPWCSGELYEALIARRMPLMVDYAAISPDDLDMVLSTYPELRLVLLNTPRLGRNRMLYPLLKRHDNLYLCLSHTYSVHQGYEDLCGTFGFERWVWGMGFPTAEGGAAVSGLMYSGISDDAKKAIAYGNIERLLGDVK